MWGKYQQNKKDEASEIDRALQQPTLLAPLGSYERMFPIDELDVAKAVGPTIIAATIQQQVYDNFIEWHRSAGYEHIYAKVVKDPHCSDKKQLGNRFA